MFIYLQGKHTSLQEQEAKLSAEVTALHEEVASLKTRAVNAEQHATELEQQLASEAETGKATLEALEKQSETLQVCVRSATMRCTQICGNCGKAQKCCARACKHLCRVFLQHVSLRL
jgi:septal ring factor EnvC (AmiA/AmiB activator)